LGEGRREELGKGSRDGCASNETMSPESVKANSERGREEKWPKKENIGFLRIGTRQSCSWRERGWCVGRNDRETRILRTVHGATGPGTARASRWLSGSQSLATEWERELFEGGALSAERPMG